jgi:hypothetical protein
MDYKLFSSRRFHVLILTRLDKQRLDCQTSSRSVRPSDLHKILNWLVTRYQASLLALMRLHPIERDDGTKYLVTKLGKAVYIAL